MTPTPRPHDAAPRASRPVPRRHVLMLALALEILVVGGLQAGRARPACITVDQTLAQGHVIT